MIMHNKFMASSILSRSPIAFVNYMPSALPGTVHVNTGLIQQLVTAAETAAGQGVSTDVDLGARDPASAWMLPYWDLTDDITQGYDAIKGQGRKYLPAFHEEANGDYEERLNATKFTNVYRDIVEALSGKPFEEEVSLTNDEATELPDQIKEFVENVDGAGNNLTSYAAATFFNGINSALDWIFVDYPKRDPSVITQADAAEKGIRPFWSRVLARNVLEAKSEMIGSAETLVYMRIYEPGLPNHVRVFERALNGVVIWALFEEQLNKDGLKKTYVLVDSGNISIGIIPLVPFATGRRDGRTFKFYPVMRDAADLQIQLYQQESGLKFAKIMTAYPMLAANGITPQLDAAGNPKKLAVGPSRVLWSKPDGNGNVGNWEYVSPDASCLTFLKEDIKETMDQLRELGRQPLTAQSGNLTVITTAYAAGKARTAVGAWTLRLKDALENALVLTAKWLDIDYDPEVSIFDDFDDYATDQASDASSLQFARTNKDISHQNYLRELKRRGTLRADFDEKRNDAELLTEVPSDDETSPDDGATDPPSKPTQNKPPVVPAKSKQRQLIN